MAHENTNVCVFTGNVVRDPRKVDAANDTVLAFFTIAVNGRKDGETAFVDCKAFNGLAEKVVLPYVKQGTFVSVTCRVTTRQEDDRGEKRTRVGFVVDKLELGPRGGGGDGEPAAASGSGSSSGDDGVPF